MFHHWDYVALCVAMAVVFALEMLGVFGKHYVTITYIIRTYMPWAARVAVWLWLGHHFLKPLPEWLQKYLGK